MALLLKQLHTSELRGSAALTCNYKHAAHKHVVIAQRSEGIIEDEQTLSGLLIQQRHRTGRNYGVV